MDIDGIRNDRAKAQVEYMGETVKFTYRPAMITAENYSTLLHGTDLVELGELFSGIISSWDLTAGGNPLPLSKQSFARLPLMLYKSIARQITQEVPQKALGED